MNVNKEAGVDCGLELSPEEMERINAMSKKKLEPGEVYAFAVRLCDNEIDRDNERFPAATLEELAPLFVGRSGLFDHQWSTRNQAARIYRTEVVRESWMTEAGEPYCYLKGCAYLLRTEGNRELIAAIEGGDQEGGQRGLRGGAVGVLHLRRGVPHLPPREGGGVRRQALLGRAGEGHRRL